MTYEAELAKVERAVRAFERGKRKSPPRFPSCSVCPEKNGRRPTVATRFGPRCREHLPAPPPTAAGHAFRLMDQTTDTCAERGCLLSRAEHAR